MATESPFAELPPPPAPSPFEASIIREALAGFPAEQDRISEYVRILAYYGLEGISFLRRNEGDVDHLSIASTGLMKRVVDVLCSMSYTPPPSRQIVDDEKGNELYSQVVADNKLNTLLQRADQFAHLHGFSALECTPAEGSKPIRLYLWDASQMIVRSEEEDSTAIGYVAVRDLTPDGRMRYTLWSPTARRVFVAKNNGQSVTAGGRATKMIEESVNPYGRLPFAFIHHQMPVNEMTVPGIGSWLSDVEASIDEKRYDLSLAVKKYALPKPWIMGVTTEFQPSDIVGEYLRIPQEVVKNDGTPSLGFLQAALDVDGVEAHIQSTISQALEASGVPEALFRMTARSQMSGEAIDAEQRPLITYSKNRQEALKQSEADLADAILSVISAWFGNEVYSYAGNTLLVEWPQDLAYVPGVDQDVQDANAMALGLESLVGITRRKFGLSSDEEAVRRLIKVQEDNRKLVELGILPAPPAPVSVAPQSDLPIEEEEQN